MCTFFPRTTPLNSQNFSSLMIPRFLSMYNILSLIVLVQVGGYKSIILLVLENMGARLQIFLNSNRKQDP